MVDFLKKTLQAIDWSLKQGCFEMPDAAKLELQLLEILQTFLKELEAERALSMVSLDASLERDLGIDSLGKVELFRRVEKRFAIRLPENAVVNVQTLRDLLKLISTTDLSSKIDVPVGERAATLAATTVQLDEVSTLVEVLKIRADKEPERPHIYWQKEQGEKQVITYAGLYQRAMQVASNLLVRKIQPGETVAIMLPTGEEFFYSFFGCLLAGIIPVPIYPPFRPDRIEEYAKREAGILNNAQARLLITFSQVESLGKMLRGFVPSLLDVVTFKDLQADIKTIKMVLPPADQPALVQYTSGSTGNPKGVLLHHENIIANVQAIGKAIPVLPSDVMVSWLPLYHDMGLMSWLGCLYFGTPITISSPLSFITRPEQWLWAIHYNRATISGAPNFAYELCTKKIDLESLAGLDLSSWRFAFSGAEAVNPKTMQQFTEKFSQFGFSEEAFAPVYGLAESTVGLTFPVHKRKPLVDKIERDAFQLDGQALPATNDKQQALEFVGCGEAIPGHQIRIVDDQNKEVTERTVGNIQFKGPSSMQGYYHNAKATAEVYSDGWWHTGDLGYLVGNELFVTGRKKDLIIKAGRNLYPEEIEQIIGQVTGIRKGCVVAFGVTEERTRTEKVVVVAEIYPHLQKNESRIRANITTAVVDNLGLTPDVIVLVSPKTIPKTSSGKLQRSAAKQAYLSDKLAVKKQSVVWQFIKLTFLSVSGRVRAGLNKTAKFIYTCYVGLLLGLTVPFLWLSLFVLPKKGRACLSHWWAKMILLAVFCPVVINNKKQLPKDKGVIFVANHASYVDSVVLLAVLPAGVLFVAKQELKKAFLFKHFIKRLGYLTVDRLDFSKSVDAESFIEKAIVQGESVIIFPEGTFTYATGLRPFKLGAFSLATKTSRPICPVAIKGTRNILRGDGFLLKPGMIKVTISKLLKPQATTWDEAIRLHKLAKVEIAKHCGEEPLELISARLD